VDVRVTAVGGRLFAAEIDSRRAGSAADYRLVLERSRVRPTRLPSSVARGLRRLVAALGLRYAAVDLRQSASGEHLFLELNPSGQWLFVEARTRQPITRALAGLLSGARPVPGTLSGPFDFGFTTRFDHGRGWREDLP
jgi:glutathione synthase/RimK-type ligase-like ATP-grasp enzyme